MHWFGYYTPNIHDHPESMTFGNRVLEDIIKDEVILDDSWPYSKFWCLLGKKKYTETITRGDSHTGTHPVKMEVCSTVSKYLLVITRSELEIKSPPPEPSGSRGLMIP